jgi:hypothetical protein
MEQSRSRAAFVSTALRRVPTPQSPGFTSFAAAAAARSPRISERYGLAQTGFATLHAICWVGATGLIVGVPPSVPAMLVGALVVIGLSLQLRVAEAMVWFSRGPSVDASAKRAAVVAAIGQAALSFALNPPLLGLLLIVWTGSIISVLAAQASGLQQPAPQAVPMTLATIFAAACAGIEPIGAFVETNPASLIALLGLSVANGAALELTSGVRRARQAADDRAPQRPVSNPAGGAALALLGAIVSACAFVFSVVFSESQAWIAASALALAAIPVLMALTAYARWPTNWRARRMETAIAAWSCASVCLVVLAPILVSLP